MFKDAIAIASKFTYPIIISQRTSAGICSAGLGAYVLVNDDGWIVTAGHILSQLMNMGQSIDRVTNHSAREAEIRADSGIDERERKKRLKALGRIQPTDIAQGGCLWGGSPSITSIDNIKVIENVDVGIGKLRGFTPNPGQPYPIFKDPTKGFDPGVFLCKLGYPFHAMTPVFNAAAQRFEYPNQAFPIPQFPMEGMFTRIGKVLTDPADDPGYPLMWVETSSPGLRGQSGGPTFDDRGTIWAIQCQTAPYDLGFESAKLPTKQYLHVGLGTHTETLFNLFDRNGVIYNVSDY
jgi:hypothetical protein